MPCRALHAPSSAAAQEMDHLLLGGSWEAESGPQAPSHAPLLHRLEVRHACIPTQPEARPSLKVSLTAHEICMRPSMYQAGMKFWAAVYAAAMELCLLSGKEENSIISSNGIGNRNGQVLPRESQCQGGVLQVSDQYSTTYLQAKTVCVFQGKKAPYEREGCCPPDVHVRII